MMYFGQTKELEIGMVFTSSIHLENPSPNKFDRITIKPFPSMKIYNILSDTLHIKYLFGFESVADFDLIYDEACNCYTSSNIYRPTKKIPVTRFDIVEEDKNSTSFSFDNREIQVRFDESKEKATIEVVEYDQNNPSKKYEYTFKYMYTGRVNFKLYRRSGYTEDAFNPLKKPELTKEYEEYLKFDPNE